MHRQHRKVAAHATTPEGIRNAVEAGVDSIEHCDDADRATLELMKKRGTFLVSTVGIIYAMRDDATTDRGRTFVDNRIAIMRRTLIMAREIGVKITGGMDASEDYLQGENARQLTGIVALGMPPIDAIRSQTVNAAELLGWSDRVGAIAAGRFGDVIAVDGDPLADISRLRHVTFVMKGGVVVR